MRIKLEDAVTKEEMIEVGVRPALHALKCDGCGTIFKMDPFSSNDQSLGELHGTFECAGIMVVDDHGKGIGNMLRAHVCSFQCAHEVFTGGWRKMAEYKPFVDAEAVAKKFGDGCVMLARGELRITAMVLNKAQIRKRWQEIDRSEASKHRALEAWSELGAPRDH